MREEEIMDH